MRPEQSTQEGRAAAVSGMRHPKTPSAQHPVSRRPYLLFLLSSPLGLELLRLIARRGELFQTRRGRVLLRHGLPVGRGGRGEPGHRRAAARTPSAVQTATPRGSSAGAAGRGAPHGLGGRAARLCDDTRQGRAHADARGTRGRAEGLERARSAHGAPRCHLPRSEADQRQGWRGACGAGWVVGARGRAEPPPGPGRRPGRRSARAPAPPRRAWRAQGARSAPSWSLQLRETGRGLVVAAALTRLSSPEPWSACRALCPTYPPSAVLRPH